MKKIYFVLIGAFFLVFVTVSIFIYNVKASYNDISFSGKSELQNADVEYTKKLSALFQHTGLSFTCETIKKGDNFWKLAKRNNINIDTLIGCNPGWENLIARVNQEVIIPSEKGVLHFITDPTAIKMLEERYETTSDKIILQQLPCLYRHYYKYLDSQPQLLVFIKDAKPLTENMSNKLARMFKIREMFRSPLGGRMSSFFGTRRHPIFNKRRFHNGLDIAAPYGRLVGVSRPGTVIAAGWMGGYGKAVIVQHDQGYKTLYGHLSRIFVRKGQRLTKNKAIGRVGSTGWSTGPHLHFTIWHNDKLINPLKVLW